MTTDLPLALRFCWVVPALPLLSFVLNGLWTCRKKESWSGPISTVLSGAAFVWSLLLAAQWRGAVAAAPDLPGRALRIDLFPWLTFGPLSSADPLRAVFGALLAPISVMMTTTVCAIVFFVHVYSIGYMREDPSRGRFFPLLSLFSFAMLGLVVSTNVLQMYVFWELVGVSSYQLIGFWYQKPAAVAASKKAFIVTRFADAFFLLGIVIASYFVGSFDFSALNSPEAARLLDRPVGLGFFGANALAISTVLIFVGGWGKSAMFPMHVWLPDAMEGPTPVSAVIHSATMVVAGVYLTARLFPLFAAAEQTLRLVAAVGAFTAVFAAVCAVAQQDIKRILAFSTISQLGYMLLSLGVSVSPAGVSALGYSASMFHVFTHAFFKCMLFLVAGSVIHVAGSNLLNRMGGLRRKMPFTYFSALAATLAISGLPPFSGFWSKDAILLAAFADGHFVVGTVGLLVGGLTAFYMFRLLFLAFHGEPRGDRSHAREDFAMTLPIVCLAFPAALAGIFSRGFFENVVLPPVETIPAGGEGFGWLPVAASLLALAGALCAWKLYAAPGANVARAVDDVHRPAWYRVIVRKFYVDEAWLFFARRIVFERVAAPVKWFDRHVVDGAMNLVGKLTSLGGAVVNAFQNGSLSVYLAFAAAGVGLLWVLGRLPF